ncbi:hypothetical protein GCM10022393_35430 [Aquimarina addita]|uniref:Uncharacterized protein n=1 Tax=Aquimarina addita TaxID=870485 RepID=A0ABP6UQI9_9FLAO
MSGLDTYKVVAFLTIIKATIPKTIPKIPQQQALKIDKIPNTKIRVELGNVSFVI